MPDEHFSRSALGAAAPIAAVVFASFFVIGLALPVLPLHVHNRLGMSEWVVGLVSGSQFLAALASRLWAGRISDSRGPKVGVTYGLIAAAIGALCYLLSLQLLYDPVLSVAVLLLGRTLVGGGESLIITGAMLWALGRVAPDRSAQVLAWIGMSMFAAMAVAAPLGSGLYAVSGFAGIAIASAVIPFACLALILPLKSLIPTNAARLPFRRVATAVLLPGIAVSFSGITFGAMTAFLPLHFAVQHWTGGAFAFSAFAAALVAARIVAGHLADRHGGAKVSIGCLAVQALGLALIAISQGNTLAIVGAALTGAGYSLVFPALGLEAVRRVPVASRGTAMGVYNAFLDLTLGIASPLLGLVAGGFGIGAVFMVSALASVIAIPLAALLVVQDRRTALQ